MSADHLVTNLGIYKRPSTGWGNDTARSKSKQDRHKRFLDDTNLFTRGASGCSESRDEHKHLPQLLAKAQGYTNASQQDGPYASPKKRAKASEVLSYAFGVADMPFDQERIDVEERERRMGLKNGKAGKMGAHLLENWINITLLRPTKDPLQKGDLNSQAAPLRGLLDHGIHRNQLSKAGIGEESINRLYQGLYVYSIGLFDLLQDIYSHNPYKFDLMTNTWRAFSCVCEAVMHVAFKSEYLDLVSLHEDQTIQLFVAREALAEARENGNEMEKTVAWLKASHAEERAERSKLSSRVNGLKSSLDRERVGHAFAVKQYLLEMDERSRFQHNVLKLDEQIVHHHKLHKALESELLNAHEENRQHLMNIQEAKRTLGMILSAFRLIANADQGSKPGAEDDIVNKAKDVQCRMGVMYSRLETEIAMKEGLQSQLNCEADKSHRLASEIAQLSADLKAASRTILDLRESLKHAIDVTGPLQEENHALKINLGESGRKLEEACASLDNARGDNSRLSARAAKLEESVSHLLETEKANLLSIHKLQEIRSDLLETSEIRKDQNIQGCVTLAVLLQQNQLLSHSRRKIKVKYEAEIRSSQSLSDRLLSEKSRSMRLEKEADDTRRLYTQREMDFLRMKVEKEAAEGKVAKSERMESSRALELSKMKSEVEDSKKAMVKMSVELEALNHKQDNLQASCDVLLAEKRKLERVIEKMEGKLHAAERTISDTEKKLSASDHDHMTTKEEATRAQLILKTDITKLNATNKGLENKLKCARIVEKNKEKDIQALTARLENKTEKKRAWKKITKDQEVEIEKLKEELDEKSGLLEDLQDRVDILEKAMRGVSRCPTPKLNHGATSEFSPEELASYLEAQERPSEVNEEEQQKLSSQIQRVETEIVAMRRNALTASGDEGSPAQLKALLGELNQLHKQRSKLFGIDPMMASPEDFQKAAKKTKDIESRLAKFQYLCLLDIIEENSVLEEELKSLKLQVNVKGEDIKDKNQEMGTMKTEIKKFQTNLVQLQVEKEDSNAQLKQCNTMISYLQAEISALKNERDKMKTQISERDIKLDHLDRALDASRKTLNSQAKDMETKFESQKKALKEDFSEEQKEWDLELTAKRNEINSITEDLKTSHGLLKDITREFLRAVECQGAKWVEHMYLPSLNHAHKEIGVWELGNPFSSSSSSFPKLSFGYETILVLISQLYVEKIKSDQAEDAKVTRPPGSRLTLEEITYDFFLQKYGVRQIAEIHMASLVAAIDKYKQNNKRIRMFGQLLGRFDPFPQDGVTFFMAMMSRIHARAGVLLTEATEGSSEIPVVVLSRILREMFRGSMAPEVASLTDRLLTVVGRDESKPVDLDLAAEMAMEAWRVERSREESQVQSVFRHTDAKSGGVVNAEDFMMALKQVDHRAANSLDSTFVQKMFRQALRNSGGGNKVIASAFADLLFAQGIAGISFDKLEYEAVQHYPPYDEFRLLEDSWKSFRWELQVLIEKMGKKPGLSNAHAAAIQNMQLFGNLLREREQLDETWNVYRKLMICFSNYRSLGVSLGQEAQGSEQQTILHSLPINLSSREKTQDVKIDETAAKSQVSCTDAAASQISGSCTTSSKSTARSQSLFGTPPVTAGRKMSLRGAVPKRSPRNFDALGQGTEDECDIFEL